MLIWINIVENLMEFKQRFLRVTTISEKPYVMQRTSSFSDAENKVFYEGFCIDLLERLSEDLNFEYQLSIVADAKYGDEIRDSANQGTGKWNGMIGEILRKVGFSRIF